MAPIFIALLSKMLTAALAGIAGAWTATWWQRVRWDDARKATLSVHSTRVYFWLHHLLKDLGSGPAIDGYPAPRVLLREFERGHLPRLSEPEGFELLMRWRCTSTLDDLVAAEATLPDQARDPAFAASARRLHRALGELGDSMIPGASSELFDEARRVAAVAVRELLERMPRPDDPGLRNMKHWPVLSAIVRIRRLLPLRSTRRFP